MARRYLLPCPSCGASTAVDATQAGLALTCSCGAALAVPTLRGLAQLEPAPLVPQRAPRTWGTSHAVTFVAAVIVALALLGAGYSANKAVQLQVYINEHAVREMIERMTPNQVMQEWRVLRQGLDKRPLEAATELRKERATWQAWTIAALVVAAIATLVAMAAAVQARNSTQRQLRELASTARSR